ncbi:unnamed protein product [Calypogeia fissa]
MGDDVGHGTAARCGQGVAWRTDGAGPGQGRQGLAGQGRALAGLVWTGSSNEGSGPEGEPGKNEKGAALWGRGRGMEWNGGKKGQRRQRPEMMSEGRKGRESVVPPKSRQDLVPEGIMKSLTLLPPGRQQQRFRWGRSGADSRAGWGRARNQARRHSNEQSI